MIEIGAGGGSIARIDRMGLLKVGPDSAGADPGPACYALGGAEPTVTDADLLLGYLDPGSSWAAGCGSTSKAARRAIEERVARPLGFDVADGAGPFIEWSTRTWRPPRASTASSVAETCAPIRSSPSAARDRSTPGMWAASSRCRALVVPFGAGAASALGLLAAPLAFDFVRTAPQRLDAADWSRQ